MDQRPSGLSNHSLFFGKRIYLSAPDSEKDSSIEAGWTDDPELQMLTEFQPVRLLTPSQIKKQHEEQDKPSSSRMNFAIRTVEDHRLVGYARIMWIEWPNRIAWFRWAIGDPKDRGHGYGLEALRLLTRYAFEELNLYRIQIGNFEYNVTCLRLLKKAGFVEEVRRREAVYHHGRHWDSVMLGMTREEWLQSGLRERND